MFFGAQAKCERAPESKFLPARGEVLVMRSHFERYLTLCLWIICGFQNLALWDFNGFALKMLMMFELDKVPYMS